MLDHLKVEANMLDHLKVEANMLDHLKVEANREQMLNHHKSEKEIKTEESNEKKKKHIRYPKGEGFDSNTGTKIDSNSTHRCTLTTSTQHNGLTEPSPPLGRSRLLTSRYQLDQSRGIDQIGFNSDWSRHQCLKAHQSPKVDKTSRWKQSLGKELANPDADLLTQTSGMHGVIWLQIRDRLGFQLRLAARLPSKDLSSVGDGRSLASLTWLRQGHPAPLGGIQRLGALGHGGTRSFNKVSLSIEEVQDQDLGSWKLLKVIAQYSRRTLLDKNLNVWPSLVHHCRPSKAIVMESGFSGTSEFLTFRDHVKFVSVETESNQSLPRASQHSTLDACKTTKNSLITLSVLSWDFWAPLNPFASGQLNWIQDPLRVGLPKPNQEGRLGVD
ncbi:hypothetical protein CR513_51566, partial [Mucuna pruriens]